MTSLTIALLILVGVSLQRILCSRKCRLARKLTERRKLRRRRNDRRMLDAIQR